MERVVRYISAMLMSGRRGLQKFSLQPRRLVWESPKMVSALEALEESKL